LLVSLDKVEDVVVRELKEFLDRVSGRYAAVMGANVDSALFSERVLEEVSEHDNVGYFLLMHKCEDGRVRVEDLGDEVEVMLEGLDEEDRKLLGFHPTSPFTGEFLQVLPLKGGPTLVVTLSYKGECSDEQVFLSADVKRTGRTFGRFVETLRERGWVVGAVDREDPPHVTFKEVDSFRVFVCGCDVRMDCALDVKKMRMITKRVEVACGDEFGCGFEIDDTPLNIDALDAVSAALSDILEGVLKEEALQDEVGRLLARRVVEFSFMKVMETGELDFRIRYDAAEGKLEKTDNVYLNDEPLVQGVDDVVDHLVEAVRGTLIE